MRILPQQSAHGGILSYYVFIICLLRGATGFVSSVSRPHSSSIGSLRQGNAIVRANTIVRRRNTELDMANRDRRTLLDDSVVFMREAFSIVQQTGLRNGVRRTTQAAAAGVGTFIEVGRELANGARDGQKLETSFTTTSPKALRRLFERLGATYVKVGQFIASSPTLFPPEYVREFQKCLDKADPMPWPVIKAIIEKDLGRPLTSVYSYVNTTPLACASIAQVYEARLRTGEDVVIKVQKPGVADTLKTDLGFLYVASRAVELLNPEFSKRLSLSDIVGDIRKSMMEEVDFTLEATNLEVFAKFLETHMLQQEATCPKVYRSASSKKVLTMERLRGVPLTDLEAIRKYSDDPERTLVAALNTWTLSVMNCDFFHADVHAGNLLVLKDGRVGFIDFGIVGRFSPSTWTGVSGLATSLALKDFRGVAENMVLMGATIGPVDIDKFARDLTELFNKFDKMDPEAMVNVGGGTGSQSEGEAVTSLLLDLTAVCDENKLRLPREFGLLIKQQLYFDRYTRILAPKLDPLRDSRIGLQRRAAESSNGSSYMTDDDRIEASRMFGGPQYLA